jgi:uncharacterized protein YbjT (DUF2867 family)
MIISCCRNLLLRHRDVGAAGKVGWRLCRQLSEREHEVAALHRKPEQSDELKKLGARPVAGSLLELNEVTLAELMSGSDTRCV